MASNRLILWLVATAIPISTGAMRVQAVRPTSIHLSEETGAHPLTSLHGFKSPSAFALESCFVVSVCDELVVANIVQVL